MQKSIDLLKTLCEAAGPPGFEDEVRAIFREQLAGVGELTGDRMGGIVCKKSGGADSPRIMLDCHLDEVAFMVRAIDAHGFLKFVGLGGWSTRVLPSQRVHVLAAGGAKIEGVIGSTPPHFLPKSNAATAPEIDDLYIDIGAVSRAEAESWGVRAGCAAVPLSAFGTTRNPNLLSGKAFDNRVGCALCIETLQQARNHPNTLYGAGSAQEEVGLRGAIVTAGLIDPDVAIVLEGPPADDTPGAKGKADCQGALGAGVQIRAFDPTMIANPRLVELAIATARAQKIPHQIAVRPTGGTNAGKIHLHGRGIPTIVLGVPVRYAHSHTGLIHLQDYRATLELTLALCQKLDRETVDYLIYASG